VEVMIYTVECSFTDPQQEEAWNEFYSSLKLPALISVKGFQTSQRFRLLRGQAPTYLAIHTIADPTVLVSNEYRRKGGGSFARWQSMITDWRRNVYAGIDIAPGVAEGQILVIGNGEASRPALVAAIKQYDLEAIALDHSPGRRLLSVLPDSQVAGPDGLHPELAFYAPMEPQLISTE
jgi:hypothetical protein